MAKIDEKKLRAFLVAEVKKINQGLGTATMNAIGDGILDEMKSMIAAGISPIEGNGRFPEYKGKTVQRKTAGGRNTKKKEGYPFSVNHRGRTGFPNKRPRPVNLFLSGRFLKKLKKFITPKVDGSAKLFIGFDDPKAMDMEEGHRTGWNGQAERATIPDGSEQFAQRIQRVIQQILNLNIEKFLKVKRR